MLLSIELPLVTPFLGYLVGNAGLFVILSQFAIAYAILIFTVTSVCAISTNGAVEGGGAYCILKFLNYFHFFQINLVFLNFSVLLTIKVLEIIKNMYS